MFNHKKIKLLQDKIILLQKDNEMLNKENRKYSELMLQEKIEQFNQLIYETKLQKEKYEETNHEILIIKNNFQKELNQLKNKI